MIKSFKQESEKNSIVEAEIKKFANEVSNAYDTLPDVPDNENVLSDKMLEKALKSSDSGNQSLRKAPKTLIIIAAVILALGLLVGCVPSIRNYIINTTNRCIEFFTNNSQNLPITEIYNFSQLPEGFVFQSRDLQKTTVRTYYKNNNNTLTITQTTSASMSLDNKHNYKVLTNKDGIAFHYLQDNPYTFLMFLHKDYCFLVTIQSDTTISDNTINALINSFFLETLIS